MKNFSITRSNEDWISYNQLILKPIHLSPKVGDDVLIYSEICELQLYNVGYELERGNLNW